MTAIEFIEELIECNADLDLMKKLIHNAKEMDNKEKHAEYMRGWKDGYSCKSIKNKIK